MRILIDGMDSRYYGAHVVGYPEIPTSEEDVELIKVANRSKGDLTIKRGYKDIEYEVRFSFANLPKTEIRKRMVKWLKGSKLETDDEKPYYLVIKKAVLSNIEHGYDYGYFNVKFTLEPFRYIDQEQVRFTRNHVFYNGGSEVIEPIITLRGTGNMTLTINDKTVSFKDVQAFITVDVERMDAYRYDRKVNNQMYGDFKDLLLPPGNNTISIGGSATSAEVDWRWRFA